MKMKRLSFLVSALMVSGAPHAEDLLDAYRDALGYDAQFASAKAQVEAVKEKVPQAEAGYLPTVGAGANTVWNKQNYDYIGQTTLPGGERKYNSNGYNLNLSQPIFRWQNLVTMDQAKLQVAQSEAQLLQARQDLILRVAQAYFDTLLAQDALETIKAQKAATAEQLASAKRNFEVGTATITDTHEAQAKFDLVVAQEIAARNDLEVKRRTLVQVTGKEPAFLNRLREKVEIRRPSPDDVSPWVESAVKGNLGVQAAQAGLEIAGREVERQRAGHYPTLDAVASYGKNAAGSGQFGVGSEVRASTIGLQLALPIYSGGAVSSRAREAEALRMKARSDLDNTARTASLNARQAYLGVSSGVAQVKALEAAMISSQSALDSNRLGYDVGVRINIDVLNAQQQLFTTKRDLAKARYDTLLAQLKLKNAIGSLKEDDLAEVNALLHAPTMPAARTGAEGTTTAPVGDTPASGKAGTVAPKSVQPKVPTGFPDGQVEPRNRLNLPGGRIKPNPSIKLEKPASVEPTRMAGYTAR